MTVSAPRALLCVTLLALPFPALAETMYSLKCDYGTEAAPASKSFLVNTASSTVDDKPATMNISMIIFDRTEGETTTHYEINRVNGAFKFAPTNAVAGTEPTTGTCAKVMYDPLAN